ncbi:MAG: arylsulfatase [Candidatus Omnitrophica bacterium]|nr:arylsulfatase [Candidatus Omnitrophota bacterium]
MKTAVNTLGCTLVPSLPIKAATSMKPNILLIMADDMGYSDAECYGGDIRTPHLSSLANHGLRFTQHYSTGRCWPSRACILTGYYAQQIRRDDMPGIKMGKRPRWAPLLPQILKSYGYMSYHSGKWHIDGSPEEGGFDRSWGRHKQGCDWDRYFDSKSWKEDEFSAPIESGKPYYSTVAIADHAIQCLRLHERDHKEKPFFQYMAFYSPHFPLHAMKQDIETYRDAYHEGWDAIRKRRWKRLKEMGIVQASLSERESEIVPDWNLKPDQLQERIGEGEVAYAVAWNSLTQEQKDFQASKMAIHAAMITRMDSEIGRVIQQLKDMGVYDNTLIMFMSDNGASAEQIIRGDGHDPEAPSGSAKSYLCLGPGWSTVANTPFRFHKHWTHEGGISSPLIVHWPKGISAQGELRHDPTHFIDFVPTVLDLVGRKKHQGSQQNPGPERPGLSLLDAFNKNSVVTHESLWWYHKGNRAIRMGDWKLTGRKGKAGEWELYNLKLDRSETNDLAAKRPEKVKALAKRWASMAQKFSDDLNHDAQ